MPSISKKLIAFFEVSLITNGRVLYNSGKLEQTKMREKQQTINKNGKGTRNLFELLDQNENVKITNRLRFVHKITPIPIDQEEVNLAKTQIQEKIEEMTKKAVSLQNYSIRTLERLGIESSSSTVRLRSGWNTAICIFQLPLVAELLKKAYPDDFSYEILKVNANLVLFESRFSAQSLQMAIHNAVRFDEL